MVDTATAAQQDYISALSDAIDKKGTPKSFDFSKVPDGVDKQKVLEVLNLPDNYTQALSGAISQGKNPKLDFSQIQTNSSSSIPQYASSQQQQQYPISSTLAKGLGVGLEGLSAPFQAVGEPIRQAITTAEGKNPGPYRAPTAIQRLLPSLQTKEQAPDMFSAIVNPASAGLKGLAATAMNASQGPQAALQVGTQAINQPPGLPEAALSMGAALGSGEAGNLPFTAAIKPFAALGKLLETGELAGIPGTGMIGKAASGVDAVPLGLENLTAHANPEVLQAAKANDVPLTPAGITGSPTLASIEGFLRKLPFSSNVMQKQFATQLEALGKVREPIVEASKPVADLGLDVQQGLSAASNSAMGKAKGLYDNVSASLPQNTPIALDNLTSKAGELLDAQSKLPAGARASGASNLLNDLVSETTEGQPTANKIMDFPTIQALRAELNSRIAQANSALGSASPNAKFQSSPEARIYSQLKDALDSDLQSFSYKTGGAFQSSYSEATKTYQAYKQQFSDDKFIQSILHEQNPENVVNKVISAAKNNPRALGTLKLNLPIDTLNDLQTYFIKDMTEKDPNVFSPTHFVSQYNSIGEKQLESILGSQKLAQLRPLYILSKASITAEKLGSSNTGSSPGIAGAVGMTAPLMMALRGIATGQPLKGIGMGMGIMGAEMEGLPMLAKAYLSKPMGKLLTRQIGMTPSFPATGAISQVAAKTNLPIEALIKQLKAKYDARRQM